MRHLVVLNLGIGDLQNGCAAVTAQVFQPGHATYAVQYIGSLPPAPELAQLYRRWQLLYREFYRQRSGMGRDAETRAITIAASGVTHFSEVEFSDLIQQMRRQLNQWLNTESFHAIDRKLSRLFDPADAIQVIIQTDDPILRRLPWHLWNFFDDFPGAEVGLSVAEYERSPERSLTTGPVRILAVLGNSDQIDVQQDRQVVEALPHTIAQFLVEPSSAALHEALWNPQGWDILFFAGHSQTEAQNDSETGRLYLNATESLTLEQLRYALKRAIRQGLKLAIFNSCDGLGLAQSLADLHIPQVIIMREVVPDRAAQVFFREFLSQFAAGQNLYTAVRNAREKLEQLETQYPCVTWLPIICQNPAEDLMTWRSPAVESASVHPSARRNRRWLLLFSLLVMLGTTGLRALGSFQTAELRALDQLMRWRPAEPPDPRLLLITITEQDVQQQNPEQRRGASLSDQALAQLLDKLRPHQPRVIGLDLYRDFAIDPASGLIPQLQQTPEIVAVCEVGEQDGTRPLQTIPAERLSFSDLPIDADGVVRRQLLGMAAAPTSRCVTDTAFSLRLAQLYLNRQGIQVSRDADGTLQIGQTRLPKLHFDSGGYHQLDALGYQIMLNYRADVPATQVTLGEVLNGSLDAQLADLVHDRIVLIGTVAPSFKDDFLTPYSQSDPLQKIPGVVIQAQMTSQIVSAVLDQRPLLRSLPTWGETIWIWIWGVLSSSLVLICRSTISLGWAGIGTTAVLVGISYGGLLQGFWLPIVPAIVVVLIISSAVVYAVWTEAKAGL